MGIREQVKKVIFNKGGIAKSADFVDAGIKAVNVVNLCNAGFLNRVRHGYYELAEKSAVSEEQLLVNLLLCREQNWMPQFFYKSTCMNK